MHPLFENNTLQRHSLYSPELSLLAETTTRPIRHRRSPTNTSASAGNRSRRSTSPPIKLGSTTARGLLAKMGLKNNAEVVGYAIEHDLLPKRG
jgi:hypothetical protein